MTPTTKQLLEDMREMMEISPKPAGPYVMTERIWALLQEYFEEMDRETGLKGIPKEFDRDLVYLLRGIDLCVEKNKHFATARWLVLKSEGKNPILVKEIDHE